MDTDRLHEALSQAGLTDYQAEVYLSLLELGSAPVVEVAERTSVPASQVYDVVRTLEDRGFVETMERDRLHARAREPVDVLEKLRQTGELLERAADEIEERWERPDPSSHRVSVVKRQETVVESAEEAIAEAEVSVELAATAAQFAELRPTLEAATDRGVVVRVAVYDPPEEYDPEESGITEVRHARTPGPFLAIVDRRQAFFSPNVHSDEPYGVLLGDEILSFIFHWYYLTCVWAPYDPISTATDRRPEYISIEEFVNDVARLWHDGAVVSVTVLGHDTDTGEYCELSGELTHILTDGSEPPAPDPSYETLAGPLRLVVDDGGDLYTVGGWGALDEDVEAEVIRVESVSSASGEAAWRDSAYLS